MPNKTNKRQSCGGGRGRAPEKKQLNKEQVEATLARLVKRGMTEEQLPLAQTLLMEKDPVKLEQAKQQFRATLTPEQLVVVERGDRKRAWIKAEFDLIRKMPEGLLSVN